MNDFDERWLQPGGVVPVDIPTTGALIREIQRLREQIDACEKGWAEDTAAPSVQSDESLDAARYRYLKNNKRLLNITIETWGRDKRTVAGPDADAIVDAYMNKYPAAAPDEVHDEVQIKEK